VNARKNVDVTVKDLGLMEYTKAWDYQTELFQSILDVKTANRDLPVAAQSLTHNYLLVCEHPPVITLGKSGDPKNLLATSEQLGLRGATYVHTNRGGDITFHGPGQLVVYPVIDLDNFFTDISRYMRSLEEAVIRTLLPYGISGQRVPGLTGVWIADAAAPRKICAMGVKTSRWVTMHGLALNVNVDLDFFDLIVPCGIQDKEVTSMKKEFGGDVDMGEVKTRLVTNLLDVLGMKSV
jgi:lipoyl(octanoyl) transferase